MEKEVFISHSKNDKKIADLICAALESSEIGCWIAPRDIPYGNNWAGEITEAIESSKLFVFLLSKSSNESRQCPKEINLADNANIPILCIKIEDVEMSAELKYHLSTKQIMMMDISIIDSQIGDLVRQIKSKIGNVESTSQKTLDGGYVLQGGRFGLSSLDEEANDDGTDEYNIDEELDLRFNSLFGNNNSQPSKDSKLKSKINEIEVNRFASEFEENLPKKISKKVIENSWFETYERPSLAVDNNREYSNGKHFTLPLLNGIRTLVFQIFEDQVDSQTEVIYNGVQLLDSTEDDINKTMTVYLDTVPIEGASLLFLHFNFEKEKIFVNSGLLENDQVMICKKPEILRFQRMRVVDDKIFLSNATYDGESVEFDETDKSNEEERWVKADIRLTPPIIIDVETATPVLRELYYDEKDKCKKARIKVKSKKNYFAFNINISGTNSASRPMTSLEKGKCYRRGSNGFSKDLLVAADLFEEDGSAEAMLECAFIFGHEDEYKDIDTYLDYLNRAISLRSEGAAVELSMAVIDDEIKSVSISECIRILTDIASEDSGVSHFVLGYLFESLDDPITAFDHYFNSAKSGFLPELVRLECSSGMIDEELKKTIYDHYTTNSQNQALCLSHYSMGSVCYYGIGIEPRKGLGLKLLEDASLQGDVFSKKALLEIYTKSSTELEQKKALQLLEEIIVEDSSFAVQLANMYIDGVGCEKSEENDKKAFSILFAMKESDDRSAINNLAWMYKVGRGCKIDYLEARKLFEKSAKMGSAASYCHLGDIYTEGLGVERDLAKALEYYKTASSMGNKKAKKTCEELDGGKS